MKTSWTDYQFKGKKGKKPNGLITILREREGSRLRETLMIEAWYVVILVANTHTSHVDIILPIS